MTPSLTRAWSVADPGPFRSGADIDRHRRRPVGQGRVDLLDGGPTGQPQASSPTPPPRRDLHRPGPGGTDRLHVSPDSCRSTTRSAVGVEHAQRRADRHHDQPVLRALAGRLVPRAGARRPVKLRRQQRAAGRLRQDPADLARRRGAAVGGPARAGASALIANSIPQTAKPCRGRRGRPSRRTSTACRQFQRSPARRSPTWSTRRRRSSRSMQPAFRSQRGIWFSATSLTGPGRRRLGTAYLHDSRLLAAALRDYCASTKRRRRSSTSGLHAPLHGTVVSRPAPSSTAPATRTRRGSANSGIRRGDYTVAAAPIYNPYVGFTFGFAMGLAASAWTYPYYGGRLYYPAYWAAIVLRTASANVTASGQHRLLGHALLVCGRGVAAARPGGTYTNQRTGTSGKLTKAAASTTPDAQRLARLRRAVKHAAGRFGQRRAAGKLQRLHGQRSTGSSVSATGAGAAPSTARRDHRRGRRAMRTPAPAPPTTRAPARPITWSTASLATNHYADVNGNVYRNHPAAAGRNPMPRLSGASDASSWPTV